MPWCSTECTTLSWWQSMDGCASQLRYCDFPDVHVQWFNLKKNYWPLNSELHLDSVLERGQADRENILLRTNFGTCQDWNHKGDSVTAHWREAETTTTTQFRLPNVLLAVLDFVFLFFPLSLLYNESTLICLHFFCKVGKINSPTRPRSPNFSSQAWFVKHPFIHA